MRIKHCLTALTSCLLLTAFQSLTAFAEVALPPGAVKGLPERLAALDNEGKPVNSVTGEYFFRVDDMKYGEIYTKKVQLMNLREDSAYHIYFYVEPVQKSGSIDLEKGCECVFWLDGKEFYRGSVTGNGNFDLTEKYYDCGLFYPGDSHVLSCSVVWNDMSVTDDVKVDHGRRLVDQNGTHILETSDDTVTIEGEIEFKWIFAARVNADDYDKDTQSTTTANDGRHTGDTGTTTAVSGGQTNDSGTTTTGDGTAKQISDTGTTASSDGKQTGDSRNTTHPQEVLGTTTYDSRIHPGSNVESTRDSRSTTVTAPANITATTITKTTSTTTTTTVTAVPEKPGDPDIPSNPGKPGHPGIPTNPDVPESPNPPGGNNPNGFFSPFTGYLAKNGTVWLVIMGVVSAGIIVLLILMYREKKKRKKKT